MKGWRATFLKVTTAARHDTGAALVTIMLLVSVMAAGAAITFDMLGFGIKRVTAQRMFGQARYYALGGQQLALAAAEKIVASGRSLTEPQAVSYAIGGGTIEGVITDASNCFNVNSLVQVTDRGAYQIETRHAAQYARLLVLLGLSDREARALTAALVDWIDSDSRPLPGGAEDYSYSNNKTPYRAANTLVSDLSELSLVEGYGPEIISIVKQYVCIDDDTAPTVLNVNTLKISEAPLLAAVIGDDFGLDAATGLIATRPARGYRDIADFYFERAFEGRTVEQAIRAQTSVKPQRFASRVRVRFHDGVGRVSSDIRMEPDGTARLVRHQFGVFQ